MLSRLPLRGTAEENDAIFNVAEKILESLPLTSKVIGQVTGVDPVMSRVLDFTRTRWPTEVEDLRLKPYFNRRFELSVEQDCVMWGLQVLIPEKYQNQMLEELHVAHPGMVRMKEVVRSYVWWPNLDRDIERTVRNCTSCQQVRNLPSVAPVMPWIWPGAPWHRVHLDFAEEEGRHYLVVVDAYSKWPEVVMMNSTTTGATIEVMRGLFSRYGIPLQIVSDNGPQFRSAEFQHFLKTNGASNGAAERMVQSFKRSLSTSKSETSHLQRRIDSFLLAYQSTKHSTTGCTPSSLFLGRELRT